MRDRILMDWDYSFTVMERREFLRRATALSAVAAAGAVTDTESASASVPSPMVQPRTRIRPRPLRPGDTVGIVAPATATFQQVELDIVRESLEGLGLKVKVGQHVRDRHGSLGGEDRDRAADLNAFFADRDVRAIFPTRGGWGSARLLPLLDYTSIAANPKIILGYSDITALLNGIHARTGLITFHGPNGGGRWDQTSLDWMKRVLFAGEAVTLANPKTTNDRNVLTQIDNRTQRIAGGRARGRLVGGNLSVLVTLLGSPYAPPMDDAILFLEDVGEQYYRVDRMMTQLALSGALGRIRGFVFGTCSECTPGDGYASLTLDEIFTDHIASLRIPAWSGAMIGHGMTQWTLPVGADVEIDADTATLRLIESAVAT
jgi:muramoyltetrapeptide carboxypeptidase